MTSGVANVRTYFYRGSLIDPPTGWLFNKKSGLLIFFEGGIAKIEAKGFGISITTKVEEGESPLESADRLVLKEQKIRKSRYYSWVKSINEKTIN